MLRGLLNLVGFLLATAVLSFLVTAAWIIFDGLHDHYTKAEMALVPGYAEIQGDKLSPALTARLDKAAELLAQGVFSKIVVSGETPINEDDETDAMAHYLQAHGVSADAIAENRPGENVGDRADSIAVYMKDRSQSAVVIAEYYRLTRLKLTLFREGIRGVQQAHTGQLQKEDVTGVLNEDIRIYQDVYQWYVFPTWKKTSETVKSDCQILIDATGTFLNPEANRR